MTYCEPSMFWGVLVMFYEYRGALYHTLDLILKADDFALKVYLLSG